MKKFIALIGKASSGKSTALNKLWMVSGGEKLLYKRKDGRAVCKIDDRVVFVQPSSPKKDEAMP